MSVLLIFGQTKLPAKPGLSPFSAISSPPGSGRPTETRRQLSLRVPRGWAQLSSSSRPAVGVPQAEGWQEEHDGLAWAGRAPSGQWPPPGAPGAASWRPPGSAIFLSGATLLKPLFWKAHTGTWTPAGSTSELCPGSSFWSEGLRNTEMYTPGYSPHQYFKSYCF